MRVGQALNCRTTICRRHHYIAAVPVIIAKMYIQASWAQSNPSQSPPLVYLAEEGGLAPDLSGVVRGRWSPGEW